MSERAKQRWRLLGEILTRGQVSLDGELSSVSVRRFSSFGLFKTRLITIDDMKEHLNESSEDDDKQNCHLWYQYMSDSFPELNAYIRHLNSTLDINRLLGFNNTGNVCVWPSEEVLAYYCLKHIDLFRNKAVVELGGGMTCQAGIAMALCVDAKEVLLTDGNEISVSNVRKIIDVNRPNFRTPNVTAGVLRWSDLSSESNLEGHFDVVICADCLFFDDARVPLVRIIEQLLKSKGLAVIFAPSRGETFQKFLDVVMSISSMLTLDVSDRYDELVWQKHCDNKAKGTEAYDPDIHFPRLIRLQKS